MRPTNPRLSSDVIENSMNLAVLDTFSHPRSDCLGYLSANVGARPWQMQSPRRSVASSNKQRLSSAEGLQLIGEQQLKAGFCREPGPGDRMKLFQSVTNTLVFTSRLVCSEEMPVLEISALLVGMYMHFFKNLVALSSFNQFPASFVLVCFHWSYLIII